MSTGKKARGGAAQSTGQKTKAGSSTAPRKSNGTNAKQATSKAQTVETIQPTHEQIALRAQHIWRQKGCLWGQEDQNWLEAETQLIAELNGKKK